MRRKEYHNNIIAAAICDSVGFKVPIYMSCEFV